MEEEIGFIEKQNELYEKLPTIEKATALFSEDIVDIMKEISDLDMGLISADLIKSNYLGNRKLDIDLSLNNTSLSTEVTYKGLTVTLNTGASFQIDFTVLDENQNPVVEELSSYASIYNRLITGIAAYNDAESDPQLHVLNTEIDVINDTLSSLPTLIRIRDVDGNASNIDRIQLQAYSGSSLETNPAYFWAKTTSALQTLANRAGDIIALGNDIGSIIALASKTDEIQYLYDDKEKLTGAGQSLYTNLTKMQEIHTQLTGLIAIYDDIKVGGPNLINTVANATYKAKVEVVAEPTYKTQVELVADNVANVNAVADNEFNINAVNDNKLNIDAVFAKLTELTNISTNMVQILASADNAAIASDKAGEAKAYRDELTALTAEAQTLDAGQSVKVTYDVNTGVWLISIPKGDKGDKGDAFQVNSVGALADRGLYDSQQKGFSFLALDESKIYFKLSDADADWSAGSPFGKGEKGDQGVGISGITKTATSGNIDTYTITYTDATIQTFDVINSDVSSVNGRTGAITLTKTDVGLENVDNTSDELKPISTAQQTAFDLKADKTDTDTKFNTTDVKTANYTALANDLVLCDTSAGAFTLTLPATPPADTKVRILDVATSFSTNNLIIGRNAQTIMALAEDSGLKTDNASVVLKFINNDWRLI